MEKPRFLHSHMQKPLQSRKFPKGKSRTQQAFKDETDVNRIMDRYTRDGLLTHVNRFQGDYADITRSPADYHDALNLLNEAQSAFEELPARLRDHLGNDPAEFIRLVDDPARRDEMRDLGLLPRVQAKDGTSPSPAAAANSDPQRENAATSATEE